MRIVHVGGDTHRHKTTHKPWFNAICKAARAAYRESAHASQGREELARLRSVYQRERRRFVASQLHRLVVSCKQDRFFFFF